MSSSRRAAVPAAATRRSAAPTPHLPDEADNHVIELAVAGRAEAIVTHNTNDFVRAELDFPGLRVLSPGGLIAED